MDLILPFLLTATLLLIVVAVIAVAVFLVRRWVRGSSGFQRTFDMVVLQVLVPKEAQESQGNTDTRGVQKVQEAIARTDAFFSAIAGLRAQRGLKAWFTGRADHVAFEIVAHRGQVKFFIAVPRDLQGYLEQQLHAQEPNAYIEEARDYNVFSPTGAIIGTTMTFKRPGYFPIKSYKKLEVDPLNALTNAMSKLGEGEGAALQFVVRSARKEWRGSGGRIAS